MNSGPRLALGARGQDVQRAQTIFVMMKTLGFDQIDGVFGPVTRNAVIAFQEGEGIAADGIIGDATWKRMPADPDTPGPETRLDRERGERLAEGPAQVWRRLAPRPTRVRRMAISGHAPKPPSKSIRRSRRCRTTAWSVRAPGGRRPGQPVRRWRPSRN